jgi:hypothetical protein
MENYIYKGYEIVSNFKPKENYLQKNIIELLEKDGLYLEYIRFQTDNLCKIAINQNWKAIKYVKNQTQELCSLAISINANAVNYIINPNILIN